MTPDIPAVQPALTAAEWQEVADGADFTIDGLLSHYGSGIDLLAHVGAPHRDPAACRHVLAALALHEQPFGFTPEDAEWCRLLAGNHTIDFAALPAWAESMRARLAALLPSV